MTVTAKKGNRRPETLKAALGYQLMLCRKNAGYSSQVEFAQALGMSDTPIAKVECGDRPPSPSLFGDWIETCGVTGQLALAIESMWHLARLKDDPQAYQAMSWEEFEEQAQSLDYWELTIIPGMIQTEDYAQSLFMTWRHSPEKVKELTARRIKRRSVLTRPDPPDVAVVIWEHALHNLVGSPGIMVAQLSLLLEFSELPHVYIHVLPAVAPAGMGMAGPVSVASTEAGEVVQMEGPAESEVTKDVSQVKLAKAIFNNVRASAKDIGDSRMIILEAVETWKARAGASPATAVPPRETASS